MLVANLADSILAILFYPVELLLNAMPAVSWPSWFQPTGPGSVGERMTEWGGFVGMLGGWFPVAAFFDALGIVAICIGAGVAIKTVRILVSLFTGGGGSAA